MWQFQYLLPFRPVKKPFFPMSLIQAWMEPQGERQRLKQTWCKSEWKWHSEVSPHPAASPVPTWHTNWYNFRNKLLSQRGRGARFERADRGDRISDKTKWREGKLMWSVLGREDIRQGGSIRERERKRREDREVVGSSSMKDTKEKVMSSKLDRKGWQSGIEEEENMT